MDLRQIEYIVTIADSKSVTAAAEKLFISQSGLNQQLVKLERELGVQLFERGHRHFHLTQAGEIYVRNAREILKIRRNTYAQLSDIRSSLSGEISLGLTHEHGIDLFTAVYPEFHERYPGIRFNLLERIVRDQQKLLRSGELDCGILLMPDTKDDSLIYDRIYREDLILGVPLTHPLAKYASPHGEALSVIDLKYFKEDSFSLIFASSTMREIVDPMFRRAGFQPQILIETAMNHALIQMVSKGFCCTILPHSRTLVNPLSKNCAWFRLTDNPQWQISLVRRRDTQMNASLRYFRELALQYGEVVEKLLHLNEEGNIVRP